MSTMTKVETISITGTDVREVAAAIWQEVLELFEYYGRLFPYNKEQLRGDLGQILLWDMTDAIKVQFYEELDGQKVERLSYEYVPFAAPEAVHSAPGTFPRYTIEPAWKVRLIAIYTTRKPAKEVLEFFEMLGWKTVEPLLRTGNGTTNRFGWFRSRDISVSRGVYKDFKDQTDTPDTTDGKEVAR